MTRSRGWLVGVVTMTVMVGVGPLAAQQTGPLPEGDAVTGRGLFTGAIRFQNGGPPCMACHSIAGIGALGGGALGPDLTGAYTKLRDAGFAAILTNMPFPTMRPIFVARPLTPEEQANLLAFFRQTVPERTRPAVARLTLLALAGVMVLLLPMHFLWKGRLSEVRRPMAGRTHGSSAAKRG